MAEEVRTPGAVAERLEWFVTSAPLYQWVTVGRVWAKDTQASQILPATVTRPCPECHTETAQWKLTAGNFATVNALTSAQYKCRNCDDAIFSIFYYWVYDLKRTVTRFYKCGQYPKPDINPPRELAKALGEHGAFYRNGMTLRHHNYGLGALVYFRRIVEETTGDLLDRLEAVVKESATGSDADPALAAIAKARAAIRFEDRVQVAAGAVPQHLMLGGTNPLGLLYQLLSDGLHVRTDEEACQIVDELDHVLGYLFTELHAHREKRHAYSEGLNRLRDRHARVKGSDGGAKT